MENARIQKHKTILELEELHEREKIKSQRNYLREALILQQ